MPQVLPWEKGKKIFFSLSAHALGEWDFFYFLPSFLPFLPYCTFSPGLSAILGHISLFPLQLRCSLKTEFCPTECEQKCPTPTGRDLLFFPHTTWKWRIQRPWLRHKTEETWVTLQKLTGHCKSTITEKIKILKKKKERNPGARIRVW